MIVGTVVWALMVEEKPAPEPLSLFEMEARLQTVLAQRGNRDSHEVDRCGSRR